MKKFLCAMLVLSILMLSGCAKLPYDVIKDYLDILSGSYISAEDSEALETAKKAIRITFYNEKDEESEFVPTTAELSEYTSQFSQYNSSYFYEMLTDNEKLIYRALEYALENGYDTIRFSSNLLSDDNDLENILFFLAMDSPLVEQNLYYTTYSFTSSYPLSNDKPHISVPFNGYRITVENFTKEMLDKKLLAIEKAKEIISEMPDDLTQIDKAEYLYRYIVNNTTYEKYESSNVYPFIYDALVGKKSHCDGFSNACSLLFNMAGIPCFEKYSKSQSNKEEGHTWCCAQIDGNWYNFDATTNASSLPKSKDLGAGCYFAFADDLLDYVPEHLEKLPSSEKGYYINRSAHFSSEKSDGVSETFVSGLSQGNKYCVVTFDTFNYENCEPILQKNR